MNKEKEEKKAEEAEEARRAYANELDRGNGASSSSSAPQQVSPSTPMHEHEPPTPMHEHEPPTPMHEHERSDLDDLMLPDVYVRQAEFDELKAQVETLVGSMQHLQAALLQEQQARIDADARERTARLEAAHDVVDLRRKFEEMEGKNTRRRVGHTENTRASVVDSVFQNLKLY